VEQLDLLEEIFLSIFAIKMNLKSLELIFYEAFPTKTDALRRESYFKTTKGKVTLRQMLKGFLK